MYTYVVFLLISMAAMVVFPSMFAKWKCLRHLKSDIPPCITCDLVLRIDITPGACRVMSFCLVFPLDFVDLGSGLKGFPSRPLGFCLLYNYIRAFNFSICKHPLLQTSKCHKKRRILASQIIHGWYIANIAVPCAEVGRKMGEPLKAPGLKVKFSYLPPLTHKFSIVISFPC